MTCVNQMLKIFTRHFYFVLLLREKKRKGNNMAVICYKDELKRKSFRALDGKTAFQANTYNLDRESKEYKKQQVGIWVDYFEVKDFCVTKNEMSFGAPVEKKYCYGLIGFPCADGFDTIAQAEECIKMKRLVSNHCYCGFGIRKTEYDPKTDTLNHTIIKQYEYANVSSVIKHTDL